MRDRDELLDLIAPADAWTPDWADVLARANTRRGRRVVGRRAVLALALLVAVLAPLAAVAADRHWWILDFGAPEAASEPVVVKTGSWDGRSWQLVAYPSTTDGVCIAMISGAAEPGEGAGLGCAPIHGVPRTRDSKDADELTVTYLASGGTKDVPAYIAGPVVSSATRVEIMFGDGETLRAPTSPGVAPLDTIRFYAARLPPPAVRQMKLGPVGFVRQITGYNGYGEVVACLAPDRIADGSRLADCH